MSGYRELETYNSQGLVRKTDSLNSSQAANLFSQPGSDCSLDSSLENSVPQLFLATSNGLHPSLVTEMFHNSFKSPKQLSQFLTNIFSHGLKTGQVEISLVLAKQFQNHNYYIRAMVESMNMVMVSHARLDIGHLVSLVTSMYEMLGSAKDSLTPLLVDILVRWVSPAVDKKKEVMLAEGATQIILHAGSAICQSSVPGYKLFVQVRAGVMGLGIVAETRAVLLDIMVIMGRQVMPGKEGVFVVDIEKKETMNCVVEVREGLLEETVIIDKENMQHQQQILTSHIENVSQEDVVVKDKLAINREGNLLDSGFVCSFATDVEKIKAALEEKIKDALEENTQAALKEEKHTAPVDTQPSTGQVQLVTPAMFEVSAGQDAQDTAFQASLVISEDNLTLLGHLVSADLGCSFPVSDQCTVGRDSSCSIMLPGKEVSRLHARVFFSDGKVIMESVSKTNNVRINRIIVNQVATLNEGDRVQVGKEVLKWHRQGAKQAEEVSEDTLWGEKGSSIYVSDEVIIDTEEVDHEKANASGDDIEDSGDEGEDAAVSDTGSVVVEMVNFIQ